MKKLNPVLILLLLVFLQVQKTEAQNRIIDSLRTALNNLPPGESDITADTIKINLLNKLSRMFINAGSYDSSFYYATRALVLADSAGPLRGLKKGLARAYNNIGLVHYFRGNYPEALKNQLSALRIQEEIKEKYGVANSYNYIGLISFAQGQYVEALKNHEASLNIKQELGDRKGIVASYVNIGNIYCNLGNYPYALKSYYSGVHEAEKTGDKPVIATCYNNIGTVYTRQNNYAMALGNYQKALAMQPDIKDKYSEAMTYTNLSDIYTKLERYEEAKEYGEKALALSADIGALELVKEANNALSTLYLATGDAPKALVYYKAAISARDSLTNEENTRKQTQLQMQYQFSKKITADSIRSVEEKKIAAAELKHEKNERVALYACLVLTVVFGAFMVNRFRVTTRQKNIIGLKEKHAQKQKQIIALQKDLVEGKQKEIIDSIGYALRIQRALLANEDLLDKNLRTPLANNNAPGAATGEGGQRDYFILFKPKDIVSGDFYWASKLPGGDFVLAIADSTGHGVPGAIMSMLNIACLNEVIVKNVTRPHEILYEARKRVIEHLKNDGSDEGGKDGMDCSVISFNFESNVLTYSGANNPVWIVRDNALIELKPDKMPVGKHARDHEMFTLHSLQLQKGDLLYAFTDGYADQFGGTDGKKFMTKKLKKTLLAIASKPITLQKQLLDEIFESWRAGAEQVDDVTVFGMSIG